MSEQKPLLGVSACLLGQSVRYDGDHQRDTWLVDVLGRHVDFLPMCPETAIGLGVPRSPIGLFSTPGGVRVQRLDDRSLDYTQAITRHAHRATRELRNVSAYVFMERSPSCGIGTAKLYDPRGRFRRRGTGIHAAVIRDRRPELPMIQSSDLGDPARCENFVSRLFVLHRWLLLGNARQSRSRVRDFLERHELMLLAHSGAALRRLRRQLEAGDGSLSRDQSENVIRTLLLALARPTGRSGQGRALRALLGRLAAGGTSLAGDGRRLVQAYLDGRRDLQATLDSLLGGVGNMDDMLMRQYYLSLL